MANAMDWPGRDPDLTNHYILQSEFLVIASYSSVTAPLGQLSCHRDRNHFSAIRFFLNLRVY
jgi:hypothetical protein